MACILALILNHNARQSLCKLRSFVSLKDTPLGLVFKKPAKNLGVRGNRHSYKCRTKSARIYVRKWLFCDTFEGYVIETGGAGGAE